MSGIAFTPLVEFHCDTMRSSYVPGLSYTARDPEEPGIPEATSAARKKLLELLPAWLEAKRVRLGTPTVAGFTAPEAATVAGEGTVE